MTPKIATLVGIHCEHPDRSFMVQEHLFEQGIFWGGDASKKRVPWNLERPYLTVLLNKETNVRFILWATPEDFAKIPKRIDSGDALELNFLTMTEDWVCNTPSQLGEVLDVLTDAVPSRLLLSSITKAMYGGKKFDSGRYHNIKLTIDDQVVPFSAVIEDWWNRVQKHNEEIINERAADLATKAVEQTFKTEEVIEAANLFHKTITDVIKGNLAK